MKNRAINIAVLLCLVLIQIESSAATSGQLAVIKQLGQLNGVALHCKALPETQRMKRALVKNLPKRRQLGELFDTETHNSFMQFINKQTQCPSPQELHQQVDAAIQELEKVYSRQ